MVRRPYLRPAAIFLLLEVVLLAQILFIYSFPSNFEDSYITYRYISTLSHSGFFDWNFDGTPVYGMTGLVFPAFSAVVNKLCGDEILSASITGIACASLFLLLVVFISRRNLSGFLVAVLLTVSPILVRGSTNGLETTLVCASIAFLFCVPVAPRMEIRWAVYAVFTFLIRPDLPLLSGTFLLIRFLSFSFRSAAIFSVAAFAMLSVTLAGAYFAFGSALPLAWFIKGGTLGIVQYPAWTISQFIVYPMLRCVPVLALVAWAIVASCRRGRYLPVAELAIPVVIFFMYQLTTLPIMNVGYRYFVPVLVFAACWFLSNPVSVDVFADNAKVKLLGIAAFAALTVPFIFTDIRDSRTYQADHAPYARLGTMLGRVPDITIASSEAGKLAYYAGRTRFIDTLGLNDSFVAMNYKDANYMAKLEARFEKAGWPDVYVRPNGGIGAGRYAWLESLPGFEAKYSCARFEDEILVCLRRSDARFESLRVQLSAAQGNAR